MAEHEAGAATTTEAPQETDEQHAKVIPLTLAELQVLMAGAWGNDPHAARELLGVADWLEAPGNREAWREAGSASLVLRGLLVITDDDTPEFSDVLMAVMACLRATTAGVRLSARIGDISEQRHLAALQAAELPLLRFDAINRWAWGISFHEPTMLAGAVEEFLLSLRGHDTPVTLVGERRSTTATTHSFELVIQPDASWNLVVDDSTGEAETEASEPPQTGSPLLTVLEKLGISDGILN